MFNPFLRFLLFSPLITLISCTTSPETPITAIPQKRVITVQGQAPITKGAKLLARAQALKNAIKNVNAEIGGKASSQTLLGSTKVVDEWVTDDTYHLQTLTVVTKGKSNTIQSCHAPYRKTIIATGFPIVTSGQLSANESQDIYSGIPREIMNLLMESGDFIGQNETHTNLYSEPDTAPKITSETGYDDSIVMNLAQEHGGQYVLSGVIRDFEIESTEYRRGAGIFSQIKSMAREFSARRGIAIDIYVHDGFSGALLFQHRYTDTVVGDVWIPVGYTVGSERFKATPAGHKVSKIIRLASQDISKLFACYPFITRIIKVEDKKVYIKAGLQTKLRQGDSLTAYATNQNVEMQENLLIGILNIKNVQGNFSVGEMEVAVDARKIKAGDLVKSW